MTLQQILGFCALAQCNNFSKAAQCVYITQPAFSRMIASLEKELGCKLFDRSKTNPKLTAAGESILPEMQAIQQHCEHIEYLLRQYRHTSTGNIALGVFKFGVVGDFRKICIEYWNQHPEVQFDIIEHTGVTIFEAIKNGSIDLLFTMYIPENCVSLVETLEIARYGYCMQCSGNHPLAQHDTVSTMELRNEKLIIYNRNHFPLMYRQLINTCANAGFVPNIVADVDTYTAMVDMVISNRGVAIVPNLPGFSSELRSIPLNGYVPEPAYLIWRKGCQKAEVQNFIEFVRTQL